MNSLVVIKWQNEFDGTIDISGFIQKLSDGYDSYWSLEKNTTVLSHGGFNLSKGINNFTHINIHVTPSDAIYFIYEPGDMLDAGGYGRDIDEDQAKFDMVIIRINYYEGISGLPIAYGLKEI